MRQTVQANASETAVTTDGSLLVSTTQLAKLLQLSVRSVWRLRSAGKLPREVRIGRCVRWRRDEILAWIHAGCPSLRSSGTGAIPLSFHTIGNTKEA